jgi:hypothetical protein
VELWQEPDSIVAPLVVGIHPDVDKRAPHVEYTLYGTHRSIPPTSVVRLVKQPRQVKRTEVTYSRQTQWVEGDGAKPYIFRVRLIDIAPGVQPNQVSPSLRIWEVGLVTAARGAAAPAIGDDLITVVLEVSNFVVAQGVVLGAPQLALFRHLWIETLRTYDPDLVVAGGQTRFEPHWWRSRAEYEADTTRPAETADDWGDEDVEM